MVNLLTKYDSEFSAFSNPYEAEKPITPQSAIAMELDAIENPAISLFEKTFNTAIENAVTSLDKAIKDKDEKAVKEYSWGLNIGLTNNLWGEWLLGFKTGSDRGKKEIDSSKDSLALFKQPVAESAIIRNRPAEDAIKARTNTLATDVSNSEWQEIKKVILESIKPQSATENPISRKELLFKINEKLGDRKDRFKNRAETIARTELTFAYNAGRLDSYVRSGLVSGVKYQTIFDERRCQICASRQGIIVGLDDVEGLARLVIPAHPRCRCVWSPVLKTEFDTESKKPGRSLKDRKLVGGKSWLAGAILAALLIPEELFVAGLLAAGIKALVSKAGSTNLARAAIASKINSVNKGFKGDSGGGDSKGGSPGGGSPGGGSPGGSSPGGSSPGGSSPGGYDPDGQLLSGKIPTQNVTSKRGVTRGQYSGAYYRSKAIVPVNKIMLAPGVDLQTASYEELRSLFDPKQLSDASLSSILSYRDRNGLSSVDDLRKVLGVSQPSLNSISKLSSDNQILRVLDPRINSSAITLWVDSGGILSKAQSRVAADLLNKETFASLYQLEQALLKKGIPQKTINSLKNYAKSKNSAIVQVPSTAVLTTVKGRAARQARTNLIRNSASSVQTNISNLREDINREIQGSYSVAEINSNQAAVASKDIGNRLSTELGKNNATVDGLRDRLKTLESQYKTLLDPSTPDYFYARAEVVKSVQAEIQTIRGQLNEVNRHASAQIAEAKSLRSVIKQRNIAITDYSDSISILQAEIDNIGAAISSNTLSPVDVSALRATRQHLQSSLDDLNNLIAQPLRDRLGDAKIITDNMAIAKKTAKNLSSRLSTLEDKIAALPTSVEGLTAAQKKAYRQLKRSVVPISDYTAPIRQAPGVKGREVRLIKANRRVREYDITNAYESAVGKAGEIAAQRDIKLLTSKVGNKQLQTQLDSSTASLQQIRSNERVVRSQNLPTLLSGSIKSVDDKIDDLVKAIDADIDNPLSNDWFSSRGDLAPTSAREIETLRNTINENIKVIDQTTRSLKNLRIKAAKVKNDLIKIKERLKVPNLNSIEKGKLNRQVEKLNVELSNLSKYERSRLEWEASHSKADLVSSDFYTGKVRDYLKQAEAIKNNTSEILSSKVPARINNAIEQARVLESSLSLSNNLSLQSRLSEARSALKERSARLSRLPKKIADLNDDDRFLWRLTRNTKAATKKAAGELDELLSDYRTSSSSLNKSINDSIKKGQSARLEIDSGEYQLGYIRDVAKQQEKVKIAIADLDDNLELAKALTDKEQGMAFIYNDIKRVYDSSIPGLSRSSPAYAVGLDEAVEIKRQLIAKVKNRGETLSATAKSTVENNPGLAVTRYKSTVVEARLKELESLKASLKNQKAKADRINGKLTELSKVNPTIHRQVKPNKIAEEIQGNTVTNLISIDNELKKLKDAQSLLKSNLSKPISYGVREKTIAEVKNGIVQEIKAPTATLNAEAIKSEVQNYTTTVKQLTASRRAELESVGIHLKSRRIKLTGSNSITDNLKSGTKLTGGQQKAYDSMTIPQQNLLQESAYTGTLDLYEDLYKASVVRGELYVDDLANSKSLLSRLGVTDSIKVTRASLATKKWDEVSGHLNNLRNLGYKDVAIELGEESAKLINLPSLPSANANRYARYQLNQLRKKLGVDLNGKAIAPSTLKVNNMANGTAALNQVDNFNYQEILGAIASNKELRHQVNNRLETFNFNRKKRIAKFNRRKTPLLEILLD